MTTELKEYVCRKCSIFLSVWELDEGCCPECNTDEDVFINDLTEEE